MNVKKGVLYPQPFIQQQNKNAEFKDKKNEKNAKVKKKKKIQTSEDIRYKNSHYED